MLTASNSKTLTQSKYIDEFFPRSMDLEENEEIINENGHLLIRKVILDKMVLKEKGIVILYKSHERSLKAHKFFQWIRTVFLLFVNSLM